MSKVISVCVPYWNRQSALLKMFENYLDQYADLPIEFSIADDGNEVPPGVLASSALPAAWSPIIVTTLPRKNRPLNPCVPINAAVNASHGDFVVLTNPEVEHPIPILREMLQAHTSVRDYIVARCMDAKGHWLAGPDVDYRKGGRLPVPPEAHFHFLAMLDRELWLEARGFDERYREGQACDDNDWVWRVYEAGGRFKTTNGAVIHGLGPRLQWNIKHNRALFEKLWPAERQVDLIRKRSLSDNEVQDFGDRVTRNPPAQVGVVYRGTDAATLHRPGVLALRWDTESPGTGPTSSPAVVGPSLATPRPNRRGHGTVLDRIYRSAGASVPSGPPLSPDVRAGESIITQDQLRAEGRGSSLLHPEWALCLGGGECVWDDVLALEKLVGRWPGVVIAANDIGSHWPRYLDHWATLHPDQFPRWTAQRKTYGFDEGYKTWSRVNYACDYVVLPWAGGSSGMLTVQVAHVLGCTKCVLAGIPMDNRRHFAESTVHDARKWLAVEGHWKAWLQQRWRMDGWLRSMSGRTQEVFGPVTMEWLTT